MTNSNECTNGGKNNSAPKLLVFGNPLLDITLTITDDSLLQKYNLEKNGQKEVSLEKLHKLINDAKQRYKSFKFTLGGSSLNSCRILSALGERNLLFFGAIGNDTNGKVVKEILKISSVNVCLQELKDIKTGTCLCLCRGDCRSLTANIGAALHVEKEFIEDKLNKLTTPPQLYYIEGFFIPEKFHIIKFLHDKYSKSTDTLLTTNLNAPYIVKNFTKDITWLVRAADIVFGNKDEFEELATINGFPAMDDLLTDLLNGYDKNGRNKVIIVTDGANPVMIYEGHLNNIQFDSHSVPEVDSDAIVDTTGAGDSFVSGFLHAFLQQKTTKSIKECVEFGCEVSAKVITVIGCNMP
ncbi:unnamed protein product [Diamesa hyperborea]